MKQCDVNNLVRSVYHTWNCGNLNTITSNVCGHLEKVLCLINEGRGGNDLAESKHGLKHEELKFDILKNIFYQKEAVFGFVDDIIADDNVDNDDAPSLYLFVVTISPLWPTIGQRRLKLHVSIERIHSCYLPSH